MIAAIYWFFRALGCFFIGHATTRERKHMFRFGDTDVVTYFCKRCAKIVVGMSTINHSKAPTPPAPEDDDEDTINVEYAVGDKILSLPTSKVKLPNNSVIIECENDKEVEWDIDDFTNETTASKANIDGLQEQIGNLLFKTDRPVNVLVSEDNWNMLDHSTMPAKKSLLPIEPLGNNVVDAVFKDVQQAYRDELARAYPDCKVVNETDDSSSGAKQEDA